MNKMVKNCYNHGFEILIDVMFILEKEKLSELKFYGLLPENREETAV